MRRCLRNVIGLIILQLQVLFAPHVALPASTDVDSLVGKWEVTGVRLDETLSRTPAYNIDDPELVGRVVIVSREKISTTMPEGACYLPVITREISTIDALVDKTMGKGKYGDDESNKFALPVDTKKEVEVFWVSCKDGHIGPDYPFGPRGHNWITRLSRDNLAMRWYDNTILLLKRVKKQHK